MSQIEFYTDTKTNVTDRIKKGLTEKFKELKDAEDRCRVTGSYPYQLFYAVQEDSKKVKHVTLKPWGWAVPK